MADTKEGIHFDAVIPDAKYANLTYEQRAMRYVPVARKLGLSAVQQKQLSALDAEQERKTQKLVGEVLKLPPDQRTRPELMGKAAEIRKETRQRIEALLTPQQREMLKGYEFRSWALTLLRTSLPEHPADAGFDVKEKITLNEQQMAILRRVLQDINTKLEVNSRELVRKASEILTVDQQDKIRDFLVKQGTW